MPKKQTVMDNSMEDLKNDNGDASITSSIQDEKSGDMYKKRRLRNNIAVRKCRSKNRLKAKETIDRVTRLRKENQDLQQKIQTLNKELSFLRDLFVGHNSSMEEGHCNIDLNCPEKQNYTDHEYSVTHKTIKSE
ncbi:CCAAT/enhancer-binding protein gamma [Octopus sinensis]|uniref:CCAAT/enhancer-binding protein gamma n=1 Tax=Octopus sinensis TaxID=2607531 RepID=A0A6P7SE40_9MOLL|nr:CCAAT/enhancer-binding protein gamma [Octopus sinensis]XP_036359048.1 CCAAT/enhancer-binding protein gamma [Octopus sinensis]XP_036359049.1 CCAAT/enhancer-binding protein gamma [Octopus sinensis]